MEQSNYQVIVKRLIRSSIITTLLFVMMFITASYSYFTSSINNTSNRVQSGELDCKLYKYETVEFVDISNDPYPIFSGNKAFDPDSIQYAVLKVTNEGEIDFDYKLKMVIDSSVDEDNMILAQAIDVYICQLNKDDDVAYQQEYASLQAAKDYNVSLTKVGTLEEINNKNIYSATILNNDSLLSLNKKDDYILVLLHFNSNDTKYQNLTIKCDIVIEAQQYDPNKVNYTEVNNKNDLINILKSTDSKNTYVKLTGNINIGTDTVDVIGTHVLDLNGHELKSNGNGSTIAVTQNANLTIENNSLNEGIVNYDSTSGGSAIRLNDGSSATINGGTFKSSSNSSKKCTIRFVNTDAKTTLVINKGKFVAPTSGRSLVLDNEMTKNSSITIGTNVYTKKSQIDALEASFEIN